VAARRLGRPDPAGTHIIVAQLSADLSSKMADAQKREDFPDPARDNVDERALNNPAKAALSDQAGRENDEDNVEPDCRQTCQGSGFAAAGRFQSAQARAERR
jgi:hypothetical protein